MGGSSKLKGLQILRALAALFVVISHTMRNYEQLAGIPLQHGWHVGNIGVDIFFVLSGFIITRTVLHSSSGLQFFKNRWMRVAPVYYLASLPWLLLAFQAGTFKWQALVVTVTFWPEVNGVMQMPLSAIGWTLCYEMLFYACAAVVVTCGRKMAYGLIAVLITCLALGQMGFHGTIDFLGNPIILEFLLGAAVARYWRGGSIGMGLISLLIALEIIAALAWIGGWGHDGNRIFRGILAWHRLGNYILDFRNTFG